MTRQQEKRRLEGKWEEERARQAREEARRQHAILETLKDRCEVAYDDVTYMQMMRHSK